MLCFFFKNCLIYYVSEGLGISDVSGLIEEQSAGSGFARRGAWKGEIWTMLEQEEGRPRRKTRRAHLGPIAQRTLEMSLGGARWLSPGLAGSQPVVFSLSAPIFKMGVIHVSLPRGCMGSFKIRTQRALKAQPPHWGLFQFPAPNCC